MSGAAQRNGCDHFRSQRNLRSLSWMGRSLMLAKRNFCCRVRRTPGSRCRKRDEGGRAAAEGIGSAKLNTLCRMLNGRDNPFPFRAAASFVPPSGLSGTTWFANAVMCDDCATINDSAWLETISVARRIFPRRSRSSGPCWRAVSAGRRVMPAKGSLAACAD